jgi:hypothetical protein
VLSTEMPAVKRRARVTLPLLRTMKRSTVYPLQATSKLQVVTSWKLQATSKLAALDCKFVDHRSALS